MDAIYARIESSVERYQRRGCRVVLVCLPCSGEVWAAEEQYTPKELYWDRFARGTAAETIHFRDHPSLSHFECPDGSHLDFADAGRFTRALAEILH